MAVNYCLITIPSYSSFSWNYYRNKLYIETIQLPETNIEIDFKQTTEKSCFPIRVMTKQSYWKLLLNKCCWHVWHVYLESNFWGTQCIIS